MYIHSYSSVTDQHEIMEFIRQNGFATIVSQTASRLWASHTPLVLSSDTKQLTGHLSRGNKAWKDFETDKQVLCIFQGPHGYVSSSWYDHENVPTWNYMIVHVYGTVRIMQGEEAWASLKELVDKYEKYSENPTSLEKMDKKYVEKEMKGIVAIAVSIEEIQASFKLSQNRDDKNYKEIIRQIEKRGHDQDAALAEAMRKKRSAI
jgi:transcriptional regulator